MPVLFVGHGSPMNAIEDNVWSRGFKALGAAMRTPRAILSISAHWYVRGTHTTGNPSPETIHDFDGFPKALYEIEYPAAGDVELAQRVTRLLGNAASVRTDWGLDHGTWSVLLHMRPAADVPVVQLSIDSRLPPARHFAIGRALSPLRDDGVLIMGSGNVVHNLGDAFGRMRRGDTSTPDWARRFDADLSRALEQHDGDFLARAVDSDTGRTAHPTLDHYLPLLYAAGASERDEAVQFPLQGFDMGSLSMRAVRWA
jgi:4,5-DOPA dioxygenase extradiol